MKSFIKIFLVLVGMIAKLSLVLLFIACNHDYKENKYIMTEYWYITKVKDKDTLSKYPLNNKGIYHFGYDSLITSCQFKYYGINHTINMYSDYFYVPPESAHITYELDSIGIFFSHNTNWYNYGKLQSNNDSINSLVDNAIEYIYKNEELHCIRCIPDENKTGFRRGTKYL